MLARVSKPTVDANASNHAKWHSAKARPKRVRNWKHSGCSRFFLLVSVNGEFLTMTPHSPKHRDRRFREQSSLFDHPAKSDSNTSLQPIDPNACVVDLPRLRGQNLAVLERLMAGPATNDELARLSRKYTSRISDVRAWLRPSGWTIRCERGNGGLNTYRIES